MGRSSTQNPSQRYDNCLDMYETSHLMAVESYEFAVAKGGTYMNHTMVASKHINGMQGVPTQLTMQADRLSFGASTRMYVLKQHGNKESGHLKRHAQEQGQQAFKKSRFAAEQAELDKAEKEVKGQFADVIKSELRPAAPSAIPGNITSVKAEQHAPARTKPEYQKFVASHLKRPPAYGTSLYDALPPEKQKPGIL